ncbi:unnamed protein product [Ceratitis capitata]|uniref:(Mediterranean fruit fly) hypothetical protein n=1 Tax=Ceratitis capitata TaxID=7213 RepID=A0A811V7G8_CERCA|nr:unnamed protein product [Ceratitis capitata]
MWRVHKWRCCAARSPFDRNEMGSSDPVPALSTCTFLSFSFVMFMTSCNDCELNVISFCFGFSAIAFDKWQMVCIDSKKGFLSAAALLPRPTYNGVCVCGYIFAHVCVLGS